MKDTMRFITVCMTLLLVSVTCVTAVCGQPVSMITPTMVSTSDTEIREAIMNIIDEIEASDLDPAQKKDLIDEINTAIQCQPIHMDNLKNALIKTGIALYGESGAHPRSNLRWAGFMHQDMAKIAGQKMGLTESACNILYEHAADPDTWSYSLNHYALTGAPDEAERLANLARGQLQIGNNDLGYEWLADSLHFMTDMSMPYHYVYESLLWHGKYEYYVSGHWGDYIGDVQANNYYYYVTDVSDSAMNLASVTHQYVSYLDNTINKTTNWENDERLHQYTRECLLHGAKYNMGLVEYVTRT